ncbi:MAG TPA: glycosyltransferase family 4 protein [Flavipsychrobacter sp.]|nr:glycosyltransferase family 4 protein [Flavipsychrobacter sp.]
MKVAFISRATLYTSAGGDTKQIELTAQYLREMGVGVDVFLSNQKIDYNLYDLLHFFNIIRPADIIKHIKSSRKPYVVSTIFVEYGNIKSETYGLRGVVKKVFSDGTLEYLKVLARAIKNGEQIVSKQYIWWGHTKSIRYVIKNASCLLPNSESEYKRLTDRYKVTGSYRIVPNGIDKRLTEKQYPVNAEYKNAVLCMGRIESRKNQLGLIRALNNTQYQVFIHGKPSPNNMVYYQQCVHEAAANIFVKDWLEDEALYTAYANAKVHVLPSYFETTGLSSLEAAVMGCNIVVTDMGDTRDYFGDNAWYCNPDDTASIKAAVDKAFNAPYNNDFREYILKHYTWEQAAKETMAAYNQVLNKK